MPLELANTHLEDRPPVEDISSLLRRISRDEDRDDNVKLAWRVFQEARAEHTDTLRADIPRLPTEARPVMAAAIARLEGRNVGAEFERQRSTGRYVLARAAAEAYGCYLVNTELSGVEYLRENLQIALSHQDEMVRRAAFDEMKRLNEPDIAKRLLTSLLEDYPNNSARRLSRRWRIYQRIKYVMAAGVIIAVLTNVPHVTKSLVIGQFAFIVVDCAIQSVLFDRQSKIGDRAQRDLLHFLAELPEEQTFSLREGLSELRAIGRGRYDSTQLRKAAEKVVRKVESSTAGLNQLPIASGSEVVAPDNLPTPVGT